MPSRRRPKSPSTSPVTSSATSAGGAPAAARVSDVERFAAALKEAEKADRAAAARQQQERVDAALRAEEAAAKVTALAVARRNLERAVESVRTAKQAGRGRAEADQAWKVAKALVIELETGVPPAWAPKPAASDEQGESVESGEDGNGVDGEVPVNSE